MSVDFWLTDETCITPLIRIDDSSKSKTEAASKASETSLEPLETPQQH